MFFLRYQTIYLPEELFKSLILFGFWPPLIFVGCAKYLGFWLGPGCLDWPPSVQPAPPHFLEIIFFTLAIINGAQC